MLEHYDYKVLSKKTKSLEMFGPAYARALPSFLVQYKKAGHIHHSVTAAKIVLEMENVCRHAAICY